VVSQELFDFFFEKTLFFGQIALLTRKIKEKTGFWQVKMRPPCISTSFRPSGNRL
jgi:hypothetical protein